jgi:guanine deaminase
MAVAITGWTVAFRADPFVVPPEEAVTSERDGAVVVSGGRIIDVGPADAVLARHPGITVEAYPGKLIMAGFVDCHIHYPQLHVIASYGTQLIDWLNTYTFPAELAFADPGHAARVAELFLDEVLANGTTTVGAYCTVHPQSADALFAAAERRDMAVVAGKVLMDRNAPEGLRDTAQSGYDESKALIDRWHGRGRARYAITPRFAPTSSPEQLEAAGALWREHPDVAMQTHLSENRDEIAWVKRLFPECPNYFSVYERFGLAGPGAVFGHAIHLKPEEIDAIRASGSAIAHCPTSNTFIGSGLFDLAGLRGERGVPVGLATDVGGGSSFSMFATMKAAYEIAQLRGVSLHPARLLWLATLGSARTLRLDHRIGNLAPGYDADIIVVDPASRPLLSERVARARDLMDVLFAQVILADDRAIHAVYVHGQRLTCK